MKTTRRIDLVADTPLLEKLDATRENEGWDMTSGSKGERIMPVLDDTEDEEGRSPKTTLVEAGVEAAEIDQMQQAAKKDQQEYFDQDSEEEGKEEGIDGDDDDDQ